MARELSRQLEAWVESEGDLKPGELDECLKAKLHQILVHKRAIVVD